MKASCEMETTKAQTAFWLEPRSRLLRTIWIALLCGGVVFVVGSYALSRPLHDFVEYWTAAHRIVAHQDPYSLVEAMKIEKALGWEEPVPLMFVCPPWALTLIAPLGVLQSYSAAWLIWLATMSLAVCAASWLLMQLYFRDVRIREISENDWQQCVFAFTFYPILIDLKFNQIAPLLLLGLAGFLYFQEKNRSTRAGAFLSLTLIKPQLLLLVWVALLLDYRDRREWKPLAAVAAVVSLLISVAIVFDVHAIQHYWALVRSPYLSINPSGIVAGIRQVLGGQNTYWMQFIPPVLGLTWFAWYWRHHRANWRWSERMPTLVVASLLASGYGWLFDQTLLAVPIIALAAHYARKEGRLPSHFVIHYTILNVGLLLGAMMSSPWTYAPAPILLAVLLSRTTVPAETPSMDCSIMVGRTEG